MTRKTYLNAESNYSIAPLPASVTRRVEEFEAEHSGAEILTVHHVEFDKWQFSYAVNRGSKQHQELNYKFTVSA
jgi:hypothetical protein